MPASQDIAKPLGRTWYVRVDRTVYGPFADDRMREFAREGRITPHSFIGLDPSQPFRLASAFPEVSAWFGGLEDAAPSGTRILLVMAEIRSGQSMDVLRVMQSLGDVVRIGDTTWIVQASATPELLLGMLSQPLSIEDRVFVTDISDSLRAGFNLGQDLDGKIADLFGPR